MRGRYEESWYEGIWGNIKTKPLKLNVGNPKISQKERKGLRETDRNPKTFAVFFASSVSSSSSSSSSSPSSLRRISEDDLRRELRAFPILPQPKGKLCGSQEK